MSLEAQGIAWEATFLEDTYGMVSFGHLVPSLLLQLPRNWVQVVCKYYGSWIAGGVNKDIWELHNMPWEPIAMTFESNNKD